MPKAAPVVTVFGGTGFIGRYVVRRLARMGAVIRIATRDPRNSLFLKPYGTPGQIVPVTCDLMKDGDLEAVLTGADMVVSLVGILHESGQATFEAIHTHFPRQLGQLAKQKGIKSLVHISAIGADPHAPSSYARSKGEGEEALRSAHPEAVILRPSVVFGPEDEFYNRFAALARVSPILPLIGGGHTRFQPVYVGDVADAVQAALTKPKAKGNVYELGGPETYTFREVLEYILEQIRVDRWLVNLPFELAELKGSILEKIPGKKMLTRDQVILLKSDNVVSMGALTLADLGISANAVEAIAPSYLERFRVGGRFAHDNDLKDKEKSKGIATEAT